MTDPDTLYNPGTSLEVGQRYLEQLLLKLDGNLLELGGAYNAGPLAVDRWRSTKAGGNDPLLFVESIPVAETRSYVKRLMLYHWLYRRRFGQDAKSLDETASGAWPIYQPYHETVPAGAGQLRPSATPELDAACRCLKRASATRSESKAWPAPRRHAQRVQQRQRQAAQGAFVRTRAH